MLHLLAEAEELLFVEPALEERTRVDAGGGVALDEDLVAQSSALDSYTSSHRQIEGSWRGAFY